MTSEDMHPFSDDPLDDLKNDLLEREPFIKSMSAMLNVTASGHASTVFSLVGPWGAGKSTILSFLKRTLLEGDSRWDIVDFNPWSYPDETAMQVGFFGELQSVLGTHGHAKKARKAVGRLSTSLAPYAGLAGSLVNVDGEALAKALGSILNGEVTGSRAFQEAHAALAESTRPVLLIMDDLDRLDPTELVLVAKLVRLVGRLPNIFYLLSYDEETLLDVLRRTSLVGNRETRARDYLEKIVQVRFDIPPLRHVKAEALVNEHLTSLTKRLDVEVATRDQIRFADAYRAVLAPRLRTLRSINRFFAQLNSFTRDLAIEVNVIDFVLLTWIRVAEPRLYLEIFNDKDWALAGSETEAESSLPGSASASGDSREVLFRKLQDAGVAPEHLVGVAVLIASLFPALQDNLSSRERILTLRDDDARDKRLGHPDFFNRYFAYALPDDDVSEIVIDAGLKALEAGLDDDRVRELEQALHARTELVTRKIRSRNAAPVPLALWLVANSPQQPDDHSWTGGPRFHMDRAVRDAVVRIRDNDFTKTMNKIAESPEGIRQIVELGLDLRVGNYPGPFGGPNVETAEQIRARIDPLLSELIPLALQKDLPPSALAASAEFWQKIHLWQAVAPGIPSQWLKERIERGQWPLVDVLAAFVPVWRSSGPPGVTHLDYLTAENLASYFDLDDVLDHLESELRELEEGSVSPRQESDTPEGRRRVALISMQTMLIQRDRESG